MERIVIPPRPNWQTHVAALGCSYYMTDDEPYWNESAYYHFSSMEISDIVTATREVEKLCLLGVDYVVEKQCYQELDIPEYAWKLIATSWRQRDRHFYGRMDFSYNGKEPPKLLEYNADTATTLIEAALLQKNWLQHVFPERLQFNSLHENMLSYWAQIASRKIHLICIDDHEEEWEHIIYLAKTIEQAKHTTQKLFINNVTWNGQLFIDEEDQPIHTLFKLYPWEWFSEMEFERIAETGMQMIEPAWKMILNNKAFLVLLWKLFPNHPNLLPTYFDEKNLRDEFVIKPINGRFGENITLQTKKSTISTNGNYDDNLMIYQQAHHLPNFDGNYPIIGSWLIGNEPSGIGIREDNTPITQNLCRFVPHCFF